MSTPAASRGFLLVVLAALCWGTSGVSGRIVADRTDLGPLDIAWHRMAIGAVVLLLGHGRPDVATVVALVVALVGLVLLVGISAGADTGTTVVLGALMAVGSALGYAVVTLAGAGVPAGVPVTLAGFVGGALLLTPLALVVGLSFTGDPVALGVLLYLGAVPSALAYALFFRGLRTVPGAVASIVTLLEPLTATALATAFLGERLEPAALAGGLLVLAAVAGLYLRRMGDSNSRGFYPNPLSKRAP